MAVYDTIVLGLGGMGSAAVAHLAARGARVLGLEQFTSPHSRGSSHGATRVVRQAYFEHPSYVPLLRRAYTLWRDLERRTNTSLLHLTGGLMLGPANSPVVSGSLRSAQEHGLQHEYLEAVEIRRRFPAFQVGEDTMALLSRRQGLWGANRVWRLICSGRLNPALSFGSKSRPWNGRRREAVKGSPLRRLRGFIQRADWF